ncbi:DUF3558 domain-containing protein [Saccharopolyspora sp. NPDC000359]|uniref:DUF3558 domain-containing protein n=1 Tax=Saccharopolyspora sp. NPDC000359 TaxID=3154251 RepID=UPI003318A2AE
MSRYSLKLAVVGAAGLILLSGCGAGGSSAQSETPSSRSAESTSEAAGLPADLDPCQLLTSEEAAQFNPKDDAERYDVAGAKNCEWALQNGLLSVAVHPDRSVDQLNLDGSDIEETSIGSRRAKVVKPSPDESTCQVVFEITDSTSAGVRVKARGGTNDEACQQATKAAGLVESRLPKN